MILSIVMVLFAGVVLNVTAAKVDVSALEPSPYPDGERSLDVALPDGRISDLDVVKIQIEFNSSPSGCVQIAAGVDGRYGISSKDSRLTLSETDFIFGWDCTEYFIRANSLKDRYTYVPEDSTVAKKRVLALTMRVSNGVAQSASFSDHNGDFQFAGLPLNPLPLWLQPLWDSLKVTVRGDYVDDSWNALENISVKFMQDSTIIVIR